MDKEYIEREAVAKKAICMHGFGNVKYVPLSAIMNQAAADVVEVVHGRWIKLDMRKGIEQFKCSICRSECYVPTCMGEPMYAFCPNCGKSMDGEKRYSDA